MKVANKNWHRLSLQQADAAAQWTVVWDTKRRAETDGRNRAVEKFETAALDRARHLLRMGFVVYEIIDPDGRMFLDEATIRQRLGFEKKLVKEPKEPPPRLPPSALSPLD